MIISWPQWQQQVLNKIRSDYAEILQHLSFDEVDWASWRDLFDQGHSADDAVDHAFVRQSATTDRRAPATRTTGRSDP